ncbi:MAG: BCCT family transporter [Bacteroides sp.]|nr:BCCT family transporter [Bacteroides sp.]
MEKISKNLLASRRIWFFVALVLVVLGMGVMGLFPNNSLEILSPLNGLIMWFALFCVLFCLINLFNKERVPGVVEFSDFAYFNLLFTLGMGVGIMVYGFNEAAALSQYSEVRNPIGLTINHWIVIPWAFYVTFAIFEIYDQKYNLLPNWLRNIKTYVYGLLMMLGIGTSFALGVITISGALENVYGISIPSYALVVLLGALVTISLLRGIHRGMKKFASFSMILLYIFMFIMILCAPSRTVANGVDAIGSFLSDFFYNNIYDGRSVQKDWTVYYWIWWISWAAFTAPFIVTISKGRTIRSVVFYTVVVPSILITLYMVVGNSIGMELLNNGNAITELPYLSIKKYSFIPPIFILLMSLFYVTSADSMSFAMDNIISKGSKIPVVYRKIMWVLLEVLFVTVLLLVGSGTTSAVQGLSFLFVPFMILIAIIFIVYVSIFYFKKFQIKS